MVRAGMTHDELLDRVLKRIKRNGVMPFLIGGNKHIDGVARQYRQGGVFYTERKALIKEAERRGITLERLYAETICDEGQMKAYEAGVPLRDILA